MEDVIVSRLEKSNRITLEESYPSFFQLAFDAMFITDPDGRFRDVNQSMLNLLGYTKQEIVNLDFFEIIVSPEMKRILQHEIESKGSVKNFNLAIKRRDGTQINCLESVIRHHSHHRLGYQGVIRNITDHLQIMNKFKKSETLLAEAQRITHLGSWEWDIQTGETQWSDELWRIYGLSPKYFEPSTEFSLSLIYPEDRALVETCLKASLSQHKPYDVKFRIVRNDGSLRFVHEKGVISWHESGKPLKMVGTMKDITEQKQAQDELQEYHKHLERLVQERTRELTQISSKLKKKVADLRKAEAQILEQYKKERQIRTELETQIERRLLFNRILIHELKTPLTAMLGSSEILLQKIKQKSLLRIVENINRGSKNLNRRINDLFDLTKAELGYLELHLTMVDVTDLLEDTIAYFAPYAKKHKQHLNLKVVDPITMIYADADRLEQVLLNLMNNATQYSGLGSNITLKAWQHEDNITIEIKDTGPGIPPNKRPRLFTPFYTLAGGGEGSNGLGLGLRLSKTLIELHGGKMWFNSKVGKGSCFSFSIPIKTNKNRAS